MYKYLVLLSVLLLAPAIDSMAQDDSIDVVPGNYLVTTITESSFSQTPETNDDNECMNENTVSVKDFLPDDNACNATNIKKSGNKLTFDIKCNQAQGMPAMNGSAEVSATKKTVYSKYKMAGDFQGTKFTVDSESKGKLTGPCK
ncbi:MAG: DUF3617 family protein [Thermodesulfobacteriota bacterium]